MYKGGGIESITVSPLMNRSLCSMCPEDPIVRQVDARCSFNKELGDYIGGEATTVVRFCDF